MKKLILFDYGGVVAFDHQDPAESTLMKRLDVSRKKISELLSEKSSHGKAFREGIITEEEFWKCVVDISKSDIDILEEYKSLTRLFCETYTINPKMLDLIKELREEHEIGILTNIDCARSDFLVEEIGIKEIIDYYLPSYKFKSSKANTEFWQIINDYVYQNIGERTIIYVDDRKKHTDNATNVGWHTIQYLNPDKVKYQIKKILRSD